MKSSPGQYGFMLAVVFGAFVARHVRSGTVSYWYDELLSVSVYGMNNPDVVAAVRHLAANSIHPPLYQASLYVWMDVFGTSELATRTLSNLFMTAAAIFVYFGARKLFGTRVAQLSLVLFAFSGLAMRYGIETRSYAMSAMLAAASICAFAYWFVGVRDGRYANRQWWRLPSSLIGLGVANVGLLLVHYYNAFFWLAQTLFVLSFVVVAAVRRNRETVRAAVQGVVAQGLQVVLVAAIWGPIAVRSYLGRQGRYEIAEEGIEHTWWEMFRTMLDQAFRFPRASATTLAVALLIGIALAFLSTTLGDLYRSHRAGIALGLVLGVGPYVIAMVGFVVLGFERFNVRYGLFGLPALSILIAVSFFHVWRLFVVTWRSWRERTEREERWPERNEPRGPGVFVALLVALVLAVPSAVAASERSKEDFRGLAKQVERMVEARPDASFFIVEAGNRREPMINYYFAGFNGDLRVEAAIVRSDDDAGIIGLDPAVLEEHCYTVVLFPHVEATEFPMTLDWLNDRYELVFADYGELYRGMAVFKTGTC